jgi:pullulanase
MSENEPNQRRILRALWTSPHAGLVVLSADWARSGLPPLFWGRDGRPLERLRRVPPLLFGEQSGYYSQGLWLTFCVRGDLYPHKKLNEHGCYVAGDFNQWDPQFGKNLWRLDRIFISGEEFFMLNIERQSLQLNKPLSFKFVTGRQEWLEPPAKAPNLFLDEKGNRNLLLRPETTGHHQFYFHPPQTVGQAGSAAVVWKDGEEVEEAYLLPGDFLRELTTRLAMGVHITPEMSIFRLFAPRASLVELRLYRKADRSDGHRFPLKRVDATTWEVRLGGSLEGWFYDYRVHGEARDNHSAFDASVPVVDPWALALVGPEGPALVLDRRRQPRPRERFDPPAWHDLVIVEAHIRDLSESAPLPLKAHERLGFRALTEWVRHPDFYLKQLGCNAVELQPIQQFEDRDPAAYAWGYMPTNWFAPASQYASDPTKGTQIAEFRELVSAFHEQGMAVILDVVYNHIGDPNALQFIDKHYYFHLSADGHYMNWSGCGNTFYADSPMGRRLIIESLCWMIEAFDVDGFRFDLADLVGVPALKEIEAALKVVKPSIILIAEPWSFRGHVGLELKKTGWASWNDGYREFLKKYVRGGGNPEGMHYFLAGSLAHMAQWPAQSVNYTESHDDRCWLDDITENGGHNGYYPTFNDRRRTHLMVAILMSSLGIPMLAEGQDFLRSKRGVHNTYQRGDLNALQYRRIRRFPATHDYFRAWIALRRGPIGRFLRLPKRPEWSYFQFISAPHTSAVGMVYNADCSLGEERLIFAVNPHSKTTTLKFGGLRSDQLRQVADHERVHSEGLPSAPFLLHGESIELPPMSCGLWIEGN